MEEFEERVTLKGFARRTALPQAVLECFVIRTFNRACLDEVHPSLAFRNDVTKDSMLQYPRAGGGTGGRGLGTITRQSQATRMVICYPP